MRELTALAFFRCAFKGAERENPVRSAEPETLPLRQTQDQSREKPERSDSDALTRGGKQPGFPGIQTRVGEREKLFHPGPGDLAEAAEKLQTLLQDPAFCLFHGDSLWRDGKNPPSALSRGLLPSHEQSLVSSDPLSLVAQYSIGDPH